MIVSGAPPPPPSIGFYDSVYYSILYIHVVYTIVRSRMPVITLVYNNADFRYYTAHMRERTYIISRRFSVH